MPAASSKPLIKIAWQSQSPRPARSVTSARTKRSPGSSIHCTCVCTYSTIVRATPSVRRSSGRAFGNAGSDVRIERESMCRAALASESAAIATAGSSALSEPARLSRFTFACSFGQSTMTAPLASSTRVTRHPARSAISAILHARTFGSCDTSLTCLSPCSFLPSTPAARAAPRSCPRCVRPCRLPRGHRRDRGHPPLRRASREWSKAGS